VSINTKWNAVIPAKAGDQCKLKVMPGIPELDPGFRRDDVQNGHAISEKIDSLLWERVRVDVSARFDSTEI